MANSKLHFCGVGKGKMFKQGSMKHSVLPFWRLFGSYVISCLLVTFCWFAFIDAVRLGVPRSSQELGIGRYKVKVPLGELGLDGAFDAVLRMTEDDYANFAKMIQPGKYDDATRLQIMNFLRNWIEKNNYGIEIGSYKCLKEENLDEPKESCREIYRSAIQTAAQQIFMRRAIEKGVYDELNSDEESPLTESITNLAKKVKSGA